MFSSSGRFKERLPGNEAPVPAFVPPPPYRTPSSGNQFLYGTPALWVLVTPRWRVHGGSKLPYFREGYDWRQEPDPRLTVVARRLDSPQPMVWAGWANSGSIDGTPGGMFMVTGLDVPTAVCWEIAAHYHPDRRTAQTLTYTVWVEPE